MPGENLGPPPPASDAFSLVDRIYVSQFGTATIGLVVHVGGVPTNADNGAVASLTDTALNTVTFSSRAATNPAPGVYDIVLTSVDTQVPDPYTLVWAYNVGGVAQVSQSYIQVGPANPAYDNLDPGLQTIVNNVWMRMGDLFDSANSGPALQAYFQSKFSRGRVAQLLQLALNRINLSAQPASTYTLDPANGQFPYANYPGFLDQALWIEVIKHLIRSYVEQPVIDGATVTRFDRRDYMDRWGQVLQMEEEVFKQEMDVYKIGMMGLSNTRVLVSGGVYGNYGPQRNIGLLAARGFYANRYY